MVTLTITIDTSEQIEDTIDTELNAPFRRWYNYNEHPKTLLDHVRNFKYNHDERILWLIRLLQLLCCAVPSILASASTLENKPIAILLLICTYVPILGLSYIDLVTQAEHMNRVYLYLNIFYYTPTTKLMQPIQPTSLEGRS